MLKDAFQRMLLRTVRRRRRLATSRSGVERLENRALLSAFVVNSFLDAVDAVPGDGVALDAEGRTTLRAAVMEANAVAGDDTITLPAGTYSFSLPGSGETQARSGDLNITDRSSRLTIIGAGADSTTIDAAGIERAFQVHRQAWLTLSRVTITGGIAGAIKNFGHLVILESSISGNTATTKGGGILNRAAGGSYVAAVEVTNSSIQGNRVLHGNGGGIYNTALGQATASVTITGSTIADNIAHDGGGVFNYAVRNNGVARIEITDSTIRGNQAAGWGGGVFNYALLDSAVAATTISRSTLEGNSAALFGGGVVNVASNHFAQATVDIQISTVSGNSASWGGGIANYRNSMNAINALTRFDLVNSTISGNTASDYGGGLLQAGYLDTVPGQGVGLFNSIVAGNTAPSGPDSWGPVRSRGHNLIGDTLDSGGFLETDLLNVDPRLGPLADNGGPTATHALLDGSPAIDAGDNSVLPSTDQRGIGRPSGSAVDMGAFEFETTTTSTETVLLPSGGGSYVVRGDAGDIVLQHEDGIELLRRERASFEFLIVLGSTGADTLSVDFSGDGAVPAGGLSFEDGFADLEFGDLLRLTGGSANMIVQTATNQLSGQVTVDGLSIHYSEIEQIRDELDTTHRVYRSREATASRITLDGGGVPNDGVSRLSLGESGARIEFLDPSGSLTIESGDENDVITLGELDSGFAAGVTIRGEAGNDRIDAALLSHAVTLIGGDGHDTLLGGRMADSLDGGAGKDLLSGRAGNDTLTGGTANDRLFGGRGSDRLDGGRGHDLLKGQGSRFDTLSGGLGNDTLNGGPGIDWLEETGDVDFRLTGSTLSGLGNDRLSGIERAHLTGGPSDNHLDARGFRWPVTLLGADGQDTLRGGRGADVLRGGRDDDRLLGDTGRDTLDGGPGDDTLNGGRGDDELRGGFGHDRLLGGSGRDSLDGGHGDDRLRGQGGGDLLLGQGGRDLLDGAAGDDTLLGGPGDDSLRGGSGQDIVLGQQGDDFVRGQGGARDTLAGGSGNDSLFGSRSEIDEAFTFFSDWLADG